jgi:hypothetical protein
MKRIALGLALFLNVGTVAKAVPVFGERMGDWASGGGELIQDGGNPWFIQNTKVVKYCTVFDDSNYHQSRLKSDLLVRRALDFWRREFATGQNIFNPRVEVATQVFLPMPCPSRLADVDMVFQFGFLDAEQLEYVKDPTRYAALTVRTDYNQQTLKGKGFIYVGADSGPQTFVGPGVVASPWTVTDGGVLYWTLVHELGHVFGLQHTTQRPEKLNVMAAGFVETIMKPGSAPWYRTDLVVNQTFDVLPTHGSVSGGDTCASPEMEYRLPMRRFLGIDPAWRCLEFRFLPNGIDVWAGPGGNSELTLVGTATIEDRRTRRGDNAFVLLRDAMRFYLPKEQTVFSDDQLSFPRKDYVAPPAFRIMDAVATYRSRDGQTVRQMTMSLDPTRDDPRGDDFKFGGMLDGKLYVNFREGI